MTEKQKKQAIGTIIVLLLLAAALAGLKLYNKHTETSQTAADEAAKVYICQPSADEITALSWQNNGGTIHLTKTDDTWTCTEQPDLTLDTDQVTSLLNILAPLEATQEIESPEDDTTYGFNTPANVITYAAGDTITTLTLGNQNDITGGIYVKTSETGKVYLASTTLETTFDCDLTTLEKTETSATSNASEAGEPSETGESTTTN